MVVHCPHCHTPIADDEAHRDCPRCGRTLSGKIGEPTLDAATINAPTELQYPVDHDDLIGSQLGCYQVERFCGQGAMARVYRAYHLTLHRACALKILSPQLVATQPKLVDALLSEARLAAQFVHPYVVTVHNIGVDRGYHFIELEYVDGPSLKTLAEGARLEIQRATRFVDHICAALAEAHRRNLIHRDVKPSNVLVNRQDVAKLADFGLARRTEDLRTGSGVSLAGTPNFMAPELWRGEPASPASDIYAVGVTYFYLCTGRYPFVSSQLAELAQLHQQQPIPDVRQWNPSTPAAAAGVIERCLAKSPKDRFQSAEELQVAVHEVYLSLRTLESILREALLGLPASINRETDQRFRIQVSIPGGRSQKVFVEECSHTNDGLDTPCSIIRVYSVCGRASPMYYQRALELNASLCFGALAVARCCGDTHFVMVHTHPRTSCDPADLRASVMSIALHADEVEKALSVEDVF